MLLPIVEKQNRHAHAIYMYLPSIHLYVIYHSNIYYEYSLDYYPLICIYICTLHIYGYAYKDLLYSKLTYP